MRFMKTWGEIFRKWKRKGVDPAMAADKADEYERRQKRVGPHCPPRPRMPPREGA